MKIKRFFAPSMRQAIREARQEQGAEAVIISTRHVDGGVELVAAVDYDESLVGASPISQSPQQHERALAARVHAVQKVEEARFPGQLPVLTQALSAPQAVRPVAQRYSAQATHDDSALVSLRQELNGLRYTLDSQLSNLSWHEYTRREPVHAAILRELTRMGISTDLARQLVEQVPEWMDRRRAWRFPLAVLAKKLPLAKQSMLESGGVIAMVGPTGVGKTTTIAKLAARFILQHGHDSVALVTTDGYRIGAQEQLVTFGRILGVPVYVANDTPELDDILARLSDKKLVLIDTAGVSHRDLRLPKQLHDLARARNRIDTCLVLAANADYSNQEQVAKTYASLKSKYCVATKLDEATTLGGLLSVCIERQLNLAFVSDGQRVPEDLREAKGVGLVCDAVECIKSTPRKINDEIMAQRFGKRAVAYA